MPWWTSGYDPEALDDQGKPLTFAYRVVVTEGYSEDRPVHVTYEAICPVCGSREESVHYTTRPDDFPRELSGVCGPSLAHGQYQPYTVRLIVARFWNYLPAEPRRLKGSAAKAAMASPPPPPRKTAAARLPHAALDDRLRRSRSSTIQTALALGYSDTAPPPVPRRDPAIIGTIAADIPKRTSPTPTTRTAPTPARARTRTQPHQTVRKPGTYSTDPTQPPSA